MYCSYPQLAVLHHLISHLPPCYETTSLEVNISLDMANLHMMNISSLDFHIWQHLEKHWNERQATTLGLHTLSSSRTTLQPHGQGHSTHHTFFIWRVNRRYTFNLDTVFAYRSLCKAIGLLIPAGLGIFCCYFFWCHPAKLACQHLQPGTPQYTIVDDDVEAAPIYICDGKA